MTVQSLFLDKHAHIMQDVTMLEKSWSKVHHWQLVENTDKIAWNEPRSRWVKR